MTGWFYSFERRKDVVEIRSLTPAKHLAIITPILHSKTIRLLPAKAIIRHDIILYSLRAWRQSAHNTD